MKTMTASKPKSEGTLPKRNPKTGRFEKGTDKAAKPAAGKTKTG